MRIPHLNDLCFLFLELCGAIGHTVVTELDDQKLFSRGMASIRARLHIFLNFYFFKSIQKYFRTSHLQNKAAN